jgi:PIN domain nuclease of toxin-antitoxin system
MLRARQKTTIKGTCPPWPRRAKKEISYDIFLSPVSAWEIVVKHSLGRLTLPEPPHLFVPRQRELHEVAPLPLDEDAVLTLGRLPEYHKDPFDRMLVCQALAHGLTILTPDAQIGQYPVQTTW